MREAETTREGDNAGTGNIERACTQTSDAVNECTLVAITSSRAGSVRDANKLSRAGRAQFNALKNAMRAVIEINSSARDAKVHMRVRLARQSSNCRARAIAS